MERFCSHGGGLPGISTYALMVPAEQLGVIVLTNLSGDDAREIAEQLASSALDTPLLRSTSETALPFDTRYTRQGTDTLTQYVGTYVYQADEENQITVEMEEDKLTVEYANGTAIPYIAIGVDVFMSQHSGSWGNNHSFCARCRGTCHQPTVRRWHPVSAAWINVFTCPAHHHSSVRTG